MGLQVWLPLNGNLENKGLGKINNIQGTPSYRANGKIGSALELNTKITISSSQLANLSTFTLCFWVNVNSSTSLTTDWADIICFNNISSTGTQGWFRCETCYNLTNWKGAHWHDNNVNAMLGSKISGTEIHTKNDDIWCHCVLVCNNKISKISFYTNGELTGEFVHNGGTINNTGTFHIGDTGITGIINDIRIYDEALSPMQIKLISQGLVAHYLLNNNGGGLPNLLSSTPTTEAKTNYLAYQIPLTQNLEAEKTYTLQLWNVDISNTGKTEDELGIGVFWGGDRIRLYRWYGASHTNYLTITFTVTTEASAHADAINSFLRFYNSPYNVSTDTKYMSIGRWKLEESDTPTPWCPNVNDTIYNSMGYNTNIEYDVSGYCHNGTKYNITDYTSDTPRYSVATKFNGTNSYINVGRGGMVRDEITVNIWGYMDDWTKYNSRLISCTEGGGWNFETWSDGKIHFTLGTGNTSNTYKSSTGYTLSELSSGWHMFTGTYDGFTVKQYVDGILNTSIDAYTTKTMIFYNANNSIIIGAEAGGGSSTAGGFFNGYLSDLRIYATALSESDLQSLYNNSGFLDSSGNIYATEYTES